MNQCDTVFVFYLIFERTKYVFKFPPPHTPKSLLDYLRALLQYEKCLHKLSTKMISLKQVRYSLLGLACVAGGLRRSGKERKSDEREGAGGEGKEKTFSPRPPPLRRFFAFSRIILDPASEMHTQYIYCTKMRVLLRCVSPTETSASYITS